MAKAKTNYFKQVSTYQKQHPRATREVAMKAVSKEISGAKKKTTVKVVKRVPPKTYKRGNSTGPSQVHTGTLTISGPRKGTGAVLSQQIAIARKIDGLESLLKHVIGMEKNKVKRLINQQHDRLDMLSKSI